MTDFELMLKEANIDLELLNKYIESDEFIKEAGPVVDFGNKNYEVKDSSIEGLGIFTTKDFNKGDVIGYGTMDGCRTIAGRYTNHSKYPNAKFYYFKDNSNTILIAEDNIKKEQEIVVNYRHHTYNKHYYE
jgi:hypothetical protein